MFSLLLFTSVLCFGSPFFNYSLCSDCTSIPLCNSHIHLFLQLYSQLLISATPFLLQPFRNIKEDVHLPVFLQHVLHICAAAFIPAPGLPPYSHLTQVLFFFPQVFQISSLLHPLLLLSYSSVIQDKVLTFPCQAVQVGTS